MTEAEAEWSDEEIDCHSYEQVLVIYKLKEFLYSYFFYQVGIQSFGHSNKKVPSFNIFAFLPKECLKMNPDDRLTCAQLLESPYFDSFQEDQIKRKARNEGRNRRRQQVPPFKS